VSKKTLSSTFPLENYVQWVWNAGWRIQSFQDITQPSSQRTVPNKKGGIWVGTSGSHLILGTQEAEIRSIVIQSQPQQIIQETLSQIKTITKKAGGVAQGIGPEFKH
jgi:hypothetical protein